MLIQALARLDGARAELMQLSPALTEQTRTKSGPWPRTAPARPAPFAFSGEAFRSLDAASLNEADLQFAQAQCASSPACTACSGRST